MAYYNPITTIASVGTVSTPIPVTIVSTTAPTERVNGGELQQGDTWWDPQNTDEYLYTVDSQGHGTWNLVGVGAISPATVDKLGGIMVGNGLAITEQGVLSINDTHHIDLQSLTVHGTATIHHIVTGADVASNVAINASAGEITAKWLNVSKNPTTDEADANYNVSLRAAGNIITPEVNVSGHNIDVNEGVTAAISTSTNLITGVIIDDSSLSPAGETRDLKVYGTPGASFRLFIRKEGATDADDSWYSFPTDPTTGTTSFGSSSSSYSSNYTIPSTGIGAGVYFLPIHFDDINLINPQSYFISVIGGTSPATNNTYRCIRCNCNNNCYWN